MLLGVGNEERGDDGVGSLLVRRLEFTGNWKCIDCGEVPESYTGVVKEFGPDCLVFVDAVNFGGAPGQVALIDLQNVKEERFDTHRPSLRVVMKYLQAETNADVFLLGIQPKSTLYGQGMSAEVAAALEVLTKSLSHLFQGLRAEVEKS